MTKIPYIEDWLSGFKPLSERYGTSMKDVIIFRWVCSTPYAKIYEDTLRKNLSMFLVPSTNYKTLDASFLAAIKPYLMNVDQRDFQTATDKKKGVADTMCYTAARDKVLASGPLGFYANKYCTDDDRSELIYLCTRDGKYHIDAIVSIFNDVAFGGKAPVKPPPPNTIESKIAKAKRTQSSKSTKQKLLTYPEQASIEVAIKTAKDTKLFSEHLRPYMKSLYVSAYAKNADTWTNYMPWGIPDTFSIGWFFIADCKRHHLTPVFLNRSISY
jgi:hypothetical protein